MCVEGAHGGPLEHLGGVGACEVGEGIDGGRHQCSDFCSKLYR